MVGMSYFRLTSEYKNAWFSVKQQNTRGYGVNIVEILSQP